MKNELTTEIHILSTVILKWKNKKMCQIIREYACTHSKHFPDWVPRFFGKKCLQKCGKCKSGEACNTVTGLCPDGCEGHLLSPFCKGNIS